VNTLTFIWHHSSSRVLELLPWFMLAVVLGQLLQSMRLEVLSAGGLRRRNATAIVGTTLFGSLTPFCACAIVPLIRSVLRAGVPLSVVMSFWIASPAMAPEEFGLTAKVFGIKIAIVRLLAAIALGIGAALVARFMEYRGWLRETSKELAGGRQQARPVGAAVSADSVAAQTGSCCTAEACSAAAGPAEPMPLALADDLAPGRMRVLPLEPAADGVTACATAMLAEPSTPATAGCGCDVGGAAGANGCASTEGAGRAGAPAADPGWLSLAKQSLREIRPVSFVRHVASDCWTLGRWMLLGILIEALVTRYVRPSAFGGLLGGHNLVLSVVVAGLLSIPLYLNGVSALPIGAALMSMGLNPAALITFLLAGSITTFPAMAGVRAVVSNRVFALYVTTGVIGPMIIGLLVAPLIN
jgi:uncharacterized protein